MNIKELKTSLIKSIKDFKEDSTFLTRTSNEILKSSRINIITIL